MKLLFSASNFSAANVSEGGFPWTPILKSGSERHCDLLIVGEAAPEQTSKEMIDWLKAAYPNVKILGLNVPVERGTSVAASS